MNHLAAVKDRLARFHAGKAAADLERAKTLIRDSAISLYVVRDHKLIPNLSSLSSEDADLIHSIDREAFRIALLDRYRHDRERQEEERRRALEAAEKHKAEDQLRIDAERQNAIARLNDVLERERFFLSQEGDRRIVPGRILDGLGLTQQDFAHEDQQRRLIEIETRLSGETATIEDYVRANPKHLKRHDDHWRLTDAAPAETRDLVALWTHEPQMHTAFARLTALSSRRAVRPPLPSSHSSALAAAANFRDTLQRDWLNSRGTDATLPGSSPSDPGGMAGTNVSPPRISRRAVPPDRSQER